MESKKRKLGGKRERKANFSEDETLTLIEEVSKERDVILGKFSSIITIQRKTEVWESICFKLNAMFGNDRRSHELKKKWKDLKSSARRSKSLENGTCAVQHHRDCFNDYVLEILGSYPAMDNANDVNDETAEAEVEYEEKPTITPNWHVHPEQLEMMVSSADEVRPEKPPMRVNPNSSYTTDEYKKKRRQERESNWKMESLVIQKRELKIKWLKSEIAKNNSIVELNQIKKEYLLAKRAKLEEEL